jgi:unsaturated rhamnogalacturonyl hydrolase
METNSHLPFVNVPETIGVSPEKDQTEKYLRLLAQYIIQNTSCQLINTKSGEILHNPASEKEVADAKIQSLFNDWKYWNGVVHMAFHELFGLLGDHKYRDHVKRNYNFFFANLPVFRKLYELQIGGASGHQFFRMDRLDDFGAMAAGLFEVYQYDPRDEYKSCLENCIQYIKTGQDRLADGTFCRNRFGYTALWGDDLYMSIPFLVRAWKYSGDDAFLEDAVQQVFNFRKHLFRPEMGLYYHYRIMQEGHPGVAHWGRANGWMVMAQCQLLEFLPIDHPRRNDLIALLKEHLIGLSRYQTANGMWRQLLDKSDSFLESSCTAMFTYGVAKAVNQGWISDIYTSIAIAGWNGLIKNCIGANGCLDKVTTGFNFKQDLPFYYNVPIEPGGDHGIGAAIYAGIEILKLNHHYRDCVWC